MTLQSLVTKQQASPSQIRNSQRTLLHQSRIPLHQRQAITQTSISTSVYCLLVLSVVVTSLQRENHIDSLKAIALHNGFSFAQKTGISSSYRISINFFVSSSFFCSVGNSIFKIPLSKDAWISVSLIASPT